MHPQASHRTVRDTLASYGSCHFLNNDNSILFPNDKFRWTQFHNVLQFVRGCSCTHLVFSGQPSYKAIVKINHYLSQGCFTIQTEEITEIQEATKLRGIEKYSSSKIFNFPGYYLAQHLNIGSTFSIGGKVTEVNL